MAEGTEQTERTHKEILAIFEDRHANIRDLKRYQWQSTYYAVAMIGGLLAVAHWSASANWLFRLLLAAGCAAAVLLWRVVNDEFNRGLARHRDGLDRAYALLSEEAQSARPTTPHDRDSVHRALFLVVVGTAIGAALAILFG